MADILVQRKWGSSGSAQPRNRLPSALKRPIAAETDGRWARPPSAVRPPSTRPDSRRSRPSSRMDSRPDSRLDSRHQEITVRHSVYNVFVCEIVKIELDLHEIEIGEQISTYNYYSVTF